MYICSSALASIFSNTYTSSIFSIFFSSNNNFAIIAFFTFKLIFTFCNSVSSKFFNFNIYSILFPWAYLLSSLATNSTCKLALSVFNLYSAFSFTSSPVTVIVFIRVPTFSFTLTLYSIVSVPLILLISFVTSFTDSSSFPFSSIYTVPSGTLPFKTTFVNSVSLCTPTLYSIISPTLTVLFSGLSSSFTDAIAPNSIFLFITVCNLISFVFFTWFCFVSVSYIICALVIDICPSSSFSGICVEHFISNVLPTSNSSLITTKNNFAFFNVVISVVHPFSESVKSSDAFAFSV